MKRTPLSIPEIALIAGTRAALGAGLALIVGDRLSRDQRHAVGWTLLGIGVITTVPILIQVLRSRPLLPKDSSAVADGRYVEHALS